MINWSSVRFPLLQVEWTCTTAGTWRSGSVVENCDGTSTIRPRVTVRKPEGAPRGVQTFGVDSFGLGTFNDLEVHLGEGGNHGLGAVPRSAPPAGLAQGACACWITE